MEDGSVFNAPIRVHVDTEDPTANCSDTDIYMLERVYKLDFCLHIFLLNIFIDIFLCKSQLMILITFVITSLMHKPELLLQSSIMPVVLQDSQSSLDGLIISEHTRYKCWILSTILGRF